MVRSINISREAAKKIYERRYFLRAAYHRRR